MYRDRVPVITPTGLCLASVISAFTLSIVLPGQAAAGNRFRSRPDTHQQVQNILDTLFPNEGLVPGLSGSVGVATSFTPEYRGSGSYHLAVLPLVRLNYKNYVRLSGTTLKVNAFTHEGLRTGILVRYIPGRNNTRSPALHGLDRIDSTVGVGPYVEYRRGHLLLSTDWTHALGAGQGDTLNFSATSGLYQSPDRKFGLQGAISTSIATARHIRTNFGVTHSEAWHSSGRFPDYNPNGGLFDVSVSLGGQYKITEHWGAGQFLELKRLLGDATNSPLVRDVSSLQLSGGVGVYYKF
ncbi:MipA/OmpV family protein [Govanella unica]|uniref:MipA/OmpV family protein n=1 Tax=Govanella unica TaxID=2975056 RepID=A0A9X3U197_9PROT|nr:MipA/OmpV family protein [Govania unica]MDA5194769.1 MipA/OmpV family protein [Govania unica]